MRIDPADIFAHSIASIPLRMTLAWTAATLGSLTPLLLGQGFAVLEDIQWFFFLLPIRLFMLPFFSGWWGVITFPLLIVLFWHLLVYLRDDTTNIQLGWMFLLSHLIAIRLSGDRWVWAALIALIVIILMLRYYRSHRTSEF